MSGVFSQPISHHIICSATKTIAVPKFACGLVGTDRHDTQSVRQQQTVSWYYCRVTLLVFSKASNQGISEVVLDGGGHFSPAGIVRVHTLSLLLLSRTAHDRAAVDSHIQDKSRHTRLTRGYSNPRQGGINSVPL